MIIVIKSEYLPTLYLIIACINQLLLNTPVSTINPPSPCLLLLHMSQVSDLVKDAKLSTKLDSECITHTFLELSLVALRCPRHRQREENETESAKPWYRLSRYSVVRGMYDRQ